MQGRLMFIFSGELVAGLEYFMQVRLKTDMEFFMQGSLKFVLYGEEESLACAHEQGEQMKRWSRCTWVQVQIDLMTNLEHFFMQGSLMFNFSLFWCYVQVNGHGLSVCCTTWSGASVPAL